MNTGEKIRTLRNLKGLSQENLADMVGISRLAYGDMERGKQEISTARLEQIATALGVTTEDIEAVEEKVSNFFSQCSVQSVNGVNKGEQHYYPDSKDLQHELEKVQLTLQNRDLQIEKLQMEVEKMALEVKYWKEKREGQQG